MRSLDIDRILADLRRYGDAADRMSVDEMIELCEYAALGRDVADAAPGHSHLQDAERHLRDTDINPNCGEVLLVVATYQERNGE